MSCQWDKALGNKWFNIKFSIIIGGFKGKLIDSFEEFHASGAFMKSLNSTLLVFILKVQDASIIMSLRLVSLVSGVYKIVAKVLATRLARVVGSMVGQC